MATNSKDAIIKALVDGIITELMIKTVGTQVWLDEGTTLSAKISEMIAAINSRAKTTDVNTLVENSINALRQELLGNLPVEAYNTFTELAKYIEEHEDVAGGLQAAIGNKADASLVNTIKATVDALGTLAKKNLVSESDLDADLQSKVNASAQGNHSHSNKTVLDSIKASDVTNWNSKGKTYVQSGQPANITANDLWIQI